jgi:hypothetical protein
VLASAWLRAQARSWAASTGGVSRSSRSQVRGGASRRRVPNVVFCGDRDTSPPSGGCWTGPVWLAGMVGSARSASTAGPHLPAGRPGRGSTPAGTAPRFRSSDPHADRCSPFRSLPAWQLWAAAPTTIPRCVRGFRRRGVSSAADDRLPRQRNRLPQPFDLCDARRRRQCVGRATERSARRRLRRRDARPTGCAGAQRDCRFRPTRVICTEGTRCTRSPSPAELIRLMPVIG